MIRRTGSRRPHHDRGAVIPIVALLLPVLILMTAFAVDLGRQRALRRDLQADADVVSLDLARLIGEPETTVSALNAVTLTALNESLLRNDRTAVTGFSDLALHGVTVTWGRWSETTCGAIVTYPDSCFVPGSEPVNAVRVVLTDDLDYFFQSGSGSATRSAVAIKGTDAVAGFAVGSFAASLSSGSSTLLNPLIGSALGLGVLSYHGLAASDLDFVGVANQLGLGTPNELFTTDVSAFDFLSAAATVLELGGGDAAQIQVLDEVLAVPNSPLHDVTVADVLGVSAGGEEAALASDLTLFDFLAASALIANGEAGVSVPATQLNLPGSGLTGSLHLVQKPQTAFGPVGTSTDTSQAGLSTSFFVSSTNVCESTANLLAQLSGLVANLLELLLGAPSCGSLLNPGKVLTVEVIGQLDVDLASAVGTSSHIACGASDELDVTTNSNLAAVTLQLNAVLKLGSTQIASIPLSTSTGQAGPNGLAEFDIPPDDYNVFEPTQPSSGALGLEAINTSGLPSIVATIVNPVVTTVVDQINSSLVVPLSQVLGVRVAGADVAALSIACDEVGLTLAE